MKSGGDWPDQAIYMSCGQFSKCGIKFLFFFLSDLAYIGETRS